MTVTGKGLCVEVDFSLPSERVKRALDQMMEWRGNPKAIRCDNGPEYISDRLISWAEQQGVELQYIQPDKPQQNAYVERYNRTVRYEWLNQHLFESIKQAQESATQWLGQSITNAPIWPLAAYHRYKKYRRLTSIFDCGY